MRMKTLTTQRWISSVILGLGLMILVYGITVEGEPTFVALLLITIGTVWLIITRVKIKQQYP